MDALSMEALADRLARIRSDRADLDERYRTRKAKLVADERTVQRSIAALSPREAPSPHSQAGRHVGAALTVLRRATKPLSQAEIGRRGNIGTGTLTHAMKALESDGLVKPTGEFEGRSRVYGLTAKGRGVSRRKAGS